MTEPRKAPDWFKRCRPSSATPAGAPSDRRSGTGPQWRQPHGRPFTGDYAGELLYSTLLAFDFAKGRYEARPDDGLKLVELHDLKLSPLRAPQNKPTRRRLPRAVAICVRASPLCRTSR